MGKWCIAKVNEHSKPLFVELKFLHCHRYLYFWVTARIFTHYNTKSKVQKDKQELQ